jgi:hypothetical protein
MTAILRELRGPVLALVLLGLFTRLLAPLAATAATERAAFDATLRASLCLSSGLSSGLSSPDAPDTPAAEPAGHCPLCRLPDADPFAPPAAAPALAAPASWPLLAPPAAYLADASLPPPRGPPPARAPPLSPTIG